MKSIITSVSPYLCEKIANCDCKILVKKSAPKEVPFKCYIYATKPKKWFRFSSCGYASDECLWLSNGKVEMGDGFKFWADGDEYQCLNGRIIGEFICNKVDNFYCVSVPYQRENNLGYGQFIDNGVYKVNSWHEGIAFERNDRYIDTMLNNDDLKEMCLTAQELFNYIDVGKHLYGWHISDLKIYNKPKELGEFIKLCNCKGHCFMCEREIVKQDKSKQMCVCYEKATRPPQSYMFVEEIETR